MAVFPYARRALWRPARIPWLIGAAFLVAISLGTTSVWLLDTSEREPTTLPLVSEASSTFVEAPAPRTASLTPIEPPSSITPALLTAAQQESLAIATASDVVMAADEAAFFVERPAIAEAVAESSEVAAEVSEATIVQVAVDAPAAPDVAPSEPAVTTAADPTTVAPAADTQTAVEVPAAAPVVAPQAAPVLPSGPVERWAAAGIYIETRGQSLDDASLANVDAALSALPASLLASLGNPALGPLHILVNTEGRVLSGDQPYGGAANFFSTNEATNELVLYPNQSVFTIVHELGHAYNLRHVGAGRYAMVLLDAEMRSFLAATGWQIASTDEQIRTAVDHIHVSYTYTGSFHWPRMSNDDPLEDFANSFAMYFLDRATLQQSSPERYAWMAGTFGN
jgi:hypothetical protein